MPFAKFRVDLAVKGGAAVLQDRLPFNEVALLQENKDFLLRQARDLKSSTCRRATQWLAGQYTCGCMPDSGA